MVANKRDSILFYSKWRSGGHLGCKHTWSRNSNNTNWISLKLGAERNLGRANMYAHLFSIRFKKNGDIAAII